MKAQLFFMRCFLGLWITFYLVVASAGVSRGASFAQNLTWEAFLKDDLVTFEKYHFRVTAGFSGGKIQIATRAKLKLKRARASHFGFTIADYYQPQIRKIFINGRLVQWRPAQQKKGFFLVKLPQVFPKGRKLNLEVFYEITNQLTSQQVFTELCGNWYPKTASPQRAKGEFEIIVPKGLVGIASGDLRRILHYNQRSRFIWEQPKALAGFGLTVGNYDYAYKAVKRQNYWVFAAAGATTKRERQQLLQWAVFINQSLQSRLGERLPRDVTLVYSDNYLPDYSFGSLCLLHKRPDQSPGQLFFSLAHEMAHYWWGHLVLPQTYQDWWLAEGFANYLAYDLVGRYKWLHVNDFLAGRAILDYWQREYVQISRSLGRLEMPEIPLAAIGPFDLQRELLYCKGAYVLHMLRSVVGERKFWAYLKKFVGEYSYRKAGVRDFSKLGLRLYGRELVGFFRQWVYAVGAYDVAIKQVIFTKRNQEYAVSIKLANLGLLNIPGRVDLKIVAGSQTYTDTVTLKGLSTMVHKTLPVPPERIEVNYQGDILEINRNNNYYLNKYLHKQK